LDISNAKIVGMFDLDQLAEKCPKLRRIFMHGCFCKTKYNSMLAVAASPSAFLNLEEYSLAFTNFYFGTNPLVYIMAKYKYIDLSVIF
jgi:hypothetical protein